MKILTFQTTFILLNCLLLISCAPDNKPSEQAAQSNAASFDIQSKHYTLKVEQLINEGLVGPWGIEFVDAEHALITGKMGQLYWMVNGKLDTQQITGLPKVYGTDLVGGMMDLALDPAYKENGWIYLAFSHNPQNSASKETPGMTKIVRGRIKDYKWLDEQVLFQVHDSLLVNQGMRWGSRFFFDKQGLLYFTIGDMQGSKQSGVDPQLLYKPQGKIFRINTDGSIPKDNPLVGRKNVIESIYAWGTRNVQGIAEHPVMGDIYFTDHGPQGGDELNILKKGANYGWPVVTYGVDYDGSIISKDSVKAGMEEPITHWTPSIAVCGITFIDGNLFPLWQNNLIVTSLKFQEVRRLVIDEGRVSEQEVLFKGHGRARDVKMGPDGALYILTNAPDAVLRITPQ